MEVNQDQEYLLLFIKTLDDQYEAVQKKLSKTKGCKERKILEDYVDELDDEINELENLVRRINKRRREINYPKIKISLQQIEDMKKE